MEGTSVSESKSRHSGDLSVGVNVGQTRGSTTTTTTSHTPLAKSCAPPAKRSYLILQIYFLSVVVIACIYFTGVGWGKVRETDIVEAFGWGTFVGVVLGIWQTVSAYKFNRNVFPGQLAEWKTLWFCMKCGHRYRVTS
jgi:hypothetical protein